MAKAVSKLGNRDPVPGMVLMYGKERDLNTGYALVLGSHTRLPLNSSAAHRLRMAMGRVNITHGKPCRINERVRLDEMDSFVVGTAAEYAELLSELRDIGEIEYDE